MLERAGFRFRDQDPICLGNRFPGSGQISRPLLHFLGNFIAPRQHSNIPLRHEIRLREPSHRELAIWIGHPFDEQDPQDLGISNRPRREIHPIKISTLDEDGEPIPGYPRELPRSQLEQRLFHRKARLDGERFGALRAPFSSQGSRPFSLNPFSDLRLRRSPRR